MSDEPNSDAVDILSELENDAKNTNNEPEEQVTSVPEESTNSESEKILAEAAAVAESQTGEITKEESVKVEDSNSYSKSVKQPTEESDEKVRNVIFVGGKTIIKNQTRLRNDKQGSKRHGPRRTKATRNSK